MTLKTKQREGAREGERDREGNKQKGSSRKAHRTQLPLKFAHSICHGQLICTQKKGGPSNLMWLFPGVQQVTGKARSWTQGVWFPVLFWPTDYLPSPDRERGPSTHLLRDHGRLESHKTAFGIQMSYQWKCLKPITAPVITPSCSSRSLGEREAQLLLKDSYHVLGAKSEPTSVH